MARAFVGTSGFAYRHWGRGVFYPVDLPQRKWLEYYAQHFATVELNVSFYRIPSQEAFRSWAHRTPPGFKFSVKGPKLITHRLKLEGVDGVLQQFTTAYRSLGDRLAVVLWQLPPRFNCDPARLRSFLAKLPDTERHAFEFRDESWFCEPVYDALREARASFCWADQPRPTPVAITSDLVYIRRHGPGGHRSRYDISELRTLADTVRKLLDDGSDVYVYFNNDVAGHAVLNARELMALLPEPAPEAPAD